MVGARRLGLPLHRDRRHGDQPGAVLLPAARCAARGACQPRAPHHRPRLGRAGDLHAATWIASSSCRRATCPARTTTGRSVATLLDLPADYDYALILTVFSDNFLQPVLQQATDLYEMTAALEPAPHPLQARAAPPPDAHRRGGVGHSRVRLGSERAAPAVDAEQVPRRPPRRPGLRACGRSASASSRQLQGVDTVAQIPFTLGREIRDDAANLLRPPASYVYQGACGGTVTGPAARFEQQTWIGHYE